MSETQSQESDNPDNLNEPVIGEIASHLSMSLEKPHMLVAEINREVEHYTPYKPEKGLLAAILERAVRDLGPSVTRIERRNAIDWFEAGECESEVAFTFAQVSEGLQLTKWQHDFIMQKVKEAYTLQEAARRRRIAQAKINFAKGHNVRLLHGDRSRT